MGSCYMAQGGLGVWWEAFLNWFQLGRATMGVAGANALTAASIEKSMTNFMEDVKLRR